MDEELALSGNRRAALSLSLEVRTPMVSSLNHS